VTTKLENLKKEIAKTKQKLETSITGKSNATKAKSLVKLFTHKKQKKVSNSSLSAKEVEENKSSLESDSD